MATVIETTTRVNPTTQQTLSWHAGISLNLAENWRQKLASICFISSFEVYGNPATLPIVESLPKIPINVYGVGKLHAENCLRVFCAELGIPLNILRLTHLYGPGERHNKAIPNFIKNCLEGRPHQLCGGGVDVREPVHVRDVAYAAWLTLGRKRNGIFNIAGGRSVTIRQILDAVQRLTEVTQPVQDRPADRPPLDVRFDLTHAREELGFEPQISLEEGLRDEIAWFRSLANQMEAIA
jgi:UDP-glucose 4-epimerase